MEGGLSELKGIRSRIKNDLDRLYIERILDNNLDRFSDSLIQVKTEIKGDEMIYKYTAKLVENNRLNFLSLKEYNERGIDNVVTTYKHNYKLNIYFVISGVLTTASPVAILSPKGVYISVPQNTRFLG